jgi:putative transposase DNA-binding domain family
LLGNINENYRKKQQKYNRFLQNYKYLLANEIIEHFTSDSIYGQYANVTHDNPIQLVFEDLNYTSLGFDANQKRQINLIKGILNVLEEKIERYNLPIEIKYVHPGYTSQNCPNCYFVAKANRNSAESNFRCQHCGFTANDDERFKGLTRVVQRAKLPSEDDFIAACNIAERLSTIPNSTRLRLRDIKYRLMQKHELVKVSCKMFAQSNIKCC